MMFHVEFTTSALKQLKKLDKYTSTMILDWIIKNLEGCDNPRLKGKILSSNRSNQYRYRIGDYRILSIIEDYKLIILVISIGHRKDIYK